VAIVKTNSISAALLDDNHPIEGMVTGSSLTSKVREKYAQESPGLDFHNALVIDSGRSPSPPDIGRSTIAFGLVLFVPLLVSIACGILKDRRERREAEAALAAGKLWRFADLKPRP
jgi:hypothetical protein